VKLLGRKVDGWRRQDLGKSYLDGVRSAIPLADFQIEVILAIIYKMELEVRAFLDMGFARLFDPQGLTTDPTEASKA
jgi:hypothetical protein